MQTEAMTSAHPAGEADFVFATAGGKVALRTTSDALTPYGGLVPWAAFARHTGIVERLTASCPVTRTSPNAKPVHDILHSFLLTALVDGRRFSHVERLREDPTVTELFGLKSVVGDDTIKRLFGAIDEAAGAAWVAQASAPIWGALPERFILDWDSTVQTKYGHQEGAARGYNPQKPGRKSFHPLVAVGAGTRLCVAYRFRSGDTVTATQWQAAMEDAQGALGGRQAWLNRGDLGLGHEAIMAWHEAAPARPKYLFKLKLTANVRRALHALPETAWQGPGEAGVWQVAEARVRLPGWTCERRVVFARKLQGQTPALAQGQFWQQVKHELAAYVTSLDESAANAWQVQALYRERADAENVFDELKGQWGFNGFCARSRRVSALAARLLLLVYNLWSLFVRLLEPNRHVEAAGSRRWFLVIAARLVQSGREKALLVSVHGRWWEQLKAGYTRVAQWLAATAPQLKIPPPLPPKTSLASA
ncbi:MAG TPA: IS1380 family transposase [Candidatus Didemnitutus sp.]|jgi:hypothetical protein